jgi:gluconolactonase
MRTRSKVIGPVPRAQDESGAWPIATAAVALERLEIFAQDLDHPEGIAVVDGTIFAGGEAGQVYAIEPDGGHRQVADTGGGMVLGLAADAEGRLYVCNETLRRLFLVDPLAGTATVLAESVSGRPLTLPNWAAFDASGSLYMTDSGGWGDADGLICVLRPGRRLEAWSDEVPCFPNGIAVAPEGDRIVGVESNPGRLFEIPIRGDGSAGPRRVLCELGLAVVPDGIAICADGSLLLGCYRPDAILRWDAVDGLDVLAADPQGVVLSAPANIAFDGERGEVLIATNLSSRHLVRGDLGVCGAPLFRPSGDGLGG